MPRTEAGLQRRVWNQILVGTLIWGVLITQPLENGILQPIAGLVLLAFFVVFPLGLLLASPGIPTIPYKVALFLQPFAAFIAAISFFMPKGVISATFAIAWLPVTLFALWNALLTVRKAGIRNLLMNPAELCFVVAQVYVPVGAIWFVGSRLGVGLMEFSEPIILLTAIHFHFAGFAAPILAGLVGQHFNQPTNQPTHPLLLIFYRIVAFIVMLGPALVAVGITFSPVVEALAGAILAFGYTG
ncbi:MAG TPA: YndJ family transporter, partial [Anaerolineales bacterium]|nr:YndJ family transporter [Anaerolineales bacterium]